MPGDNFGAAVGLNLQQIEEMSRLGYSREAVETIIKLHQSGLDLPLAAIAAEQVMGLNSKTQAPPINYNREGKPENEWETFEREQPTRANTKRLIHAGAGAVKDATKPLWKSVDVEKAAAHKMLKDYLMTQDQQKAEEGRKEQLWAMARMGPRVFSVDQAPLQAPNSPSNAMRMMQQATNPQEQLTEHIPVRGMQQGAAPGPSGPVSMGNQVMVDPSRRMLNVRP